MSTVQQLALDLGDGAPRSVAIDTKTGKKLEPPAPRMKTAPAARNAAIEQVTENERRAWRELHDKELTAFLTEKGTGAFIAEDFRRWFIARGHDAPHHPNVWGAMWMSATNHGHVIKTGRYLAPQDVRSHARLTTEWTKGAP